MSRSLKLLARNSMSPLSRSPSFNRGPEQQTDKRPLLSDLRESGSIEQDSGRSLFFCIVKTLMERESPRAGEAGPDRGEA